jgi:hypothetical protein
MTECATNIRGQGFSVFLQSRESFMQEIMELHDRLDTCCGPVSINKDTHK